MQRDALRSVCRELPCPLLVACEVPVYRLRMNHRGSHARCGCLEHNFTEMSFKIAGLRLRKSFDFDGQTTAASKPGQLTQGVR
jgi:hypothetical protein